MPFFRWLRLVEKAPKYLPLKLVAFYVRDHNERMPHYAFNGQPPDEMYFGGRHGSVENWDQSVPGSESLKPSKVPSGCPMKATTFDRKARETQCDRRFLPKEEPSGSVDLYCDEESPLR